MNHSLMEHLMVCYCHELETNWEAKQQLKIKMVELLVSLANSLANKVEESKEAIQKNNAHKSVDTQLIY